MCNISYVFVIYIYICRMCICDMYICHTHTHTHTPLQTLEHHHKENRTPFSEVPHVCHTLQHTATHCSTLQHTATHCNTLQHTATHCNFYKLLSIIMKGIELHFRLALSLSLFVSLPFSLSLSLSHTHTHTHLYKLLSIIMKRVELHLGLDNLVIVALVLNRRRHFSTNRRTQQLPKLFVLSQCVAVCCSVLQHVAAVYLT